MGVVAPGVSGQKGMRQGMFVQMRRGNTNAALAQRCRVAVSHCITPSGPHLTWADVPRSEQLHLIRLNFRAATLAFFREQK